VLHHQCAAQHIPDAAAAAAAVALQVALPPPQMLIFDPDLLQVFVNAVSAVRRLAALLQLLGLPAGALHAQQQQRQRLKALDRFKTHPHGVLVATDVAARGLDIPDVQVGRGLNNNTIQQQQHTTTTTTICCLVLMALLVRLKNFVASSCWGNQGQTASGGAAAWRLSWSLSDKQHNKSPVHYKPHH
jgi:hypothetical protein